MKDNFDRTLEKKKEIRDFLQKIDSSFYDYVDIVWFKDKADRKSFKITKFDISLDKQEIRLEIEDPPTNPTYTEAYILGKGNLFLFQVPLKEIQGHKVSLGIPEVIKIKELRQSSRTNFTPPIDLNFLECSFPSKGGGKDIKTICIILNLSKDGACILLSKDTFQRIDLKKNLVVAGLSIHAEIEENERDSLIRNVRVHSKQTLERNEILAVGIEFI